MREAAPPDSPGLPWLLSTWRKVAKHTLAEVGEELSGIRSLTPAAISAWERQPRRRVGHSTLDRLDNFYKAGGGLRDMAQAVATPDVFDARKVWQHNFTGPSGPVWAWLRAKPGQRHLSGTLYWGPAKLELKRRRCGPLGLVVLAPASIPNPPVKVELSEAGWVDFGRGRVPRELGIRRIHAIPHARAHKAGANIFNVSTSKVDTFVHDRELQLEEAKRLFRTGDDAKAQEEIMKAGLFTFTDVTEQRPSAEARGMPFDGPRLRALRNARGFTEQEVATLATAMIPPDDTTVPPVDDNTIQRLEKEGSAPRGKWVMSRLDILYGADGLISRDPVSPMPQGTRTWTADFRDQWEGAVESQEFQVPFPPYWVGPIWVRFLLSHVEDDIDTANVLLRWDPWQKPLKVRTGMTITTRCAGNGTPLTIDIPVNWRLEAGLGFDPSAIDVQDEWSAIDPTRAAQIFDQMRRVWVSTFGTTAESFRRAVRRSQRHS